MHALNSSLLYCYTTSDYIMVLDWQARSVTVHRLACQKGIAQFLCQTWTPERCWKNVCILKDDRCIVCGAHCWMCSCCLFSLSLSPLSSLSSLSIVAKIIHTQVAAHKNSFVNKNYPVCMRRSWNLYQQWLNVYTLSVAKEKLFSLFIAESLAIVTTIMLVEIPPHLPW